MSFAQFLERLFCSEVLRPEVSNHSVPTMLALKEKDSYSAVTVACHTQDLLPKAHFRLHDPKG